MNEKWKSIFIKIYTGQAISILTSGIVQFALILYITKTTQSAFYLAMASIVGFLPQGILSIFIGTFIDTHSRKKIMIYADLFIALVTFILIICITQNLLSIELILLFLMVRSIGSAFHAPALQASVPMIVPEDHLLKYNGYIMAVQSASLILSPVLGAFLYDYFSLSLILSLDIIGAVLAVIMIIIVTIPEIISNETEKTDYWLELKNGLLIIKDNKKIRLLFIYIFFFTLLYMPINALFPLIVTSYFKMEAIHLGIVEAFFAVGMLIGSYIIGKLTIFKDLDRNIIIACFLVTFALIITGLLPTNMYLIFTLLSLIIGLSGPIFNSSFSTILGQTIDPAFLGRIYSNVMAMTLITMPLGLLFTGLFADDIGIHIWFLITGILMMILVVFQIYSYRKLKQQNSI